MDDERLRAEREEDETPPGIFPTWGWLYAAVVAYTVVLVAVLWIFTVTLDAGAR